MNAQRSTALAAISYDDESAAFRQSWGGADANPGGERLLVQEREKTWEVIRELVDDMSAFDVFLYANDFHNLKAAIKQVCGNAEEPGIFIGHGTVAFKQGLSAVESHDFSSLPQTMAAPAEEAYTVFSQTRDGQLCDIIVDRAALEAIHAAGKASRNELLEKYAETNGGGRRH